MTKDKSKQRQLLKAYLDQYCKINRRMEALKWRLEAARDALSCPSMRSGLSGAASGGGKGGVSAGAAAPILREESLSERFEREQRQCAAIMGEVLDTLDFLPFSPRREILEYRHLDGLRWKEISGKLDLSHATCRRRYERGLDELLSLRRVQARLAAFEEERNRAGL